MLINLTDIFTSEGKERTESIPYEPIWEVFILFGTRYRRLFVLPMWEKEECL